MPVASASKAEKNPKFTFDQVRDLLARGWNLHDVELRELGSLEEQNFAVTTGGQTAVLKIATQGTPASALELQNAAMKHIRERNLAYLTPRPISATSGAESRLEADFPVRLLTWVSGTPLHQVGRLLASEFEALGEVAGAISAALEDFHHPGLDRISEWDPRHATRVLATNLHFVEDAAIRELVQVAARAVDGMGRFDGALPLRAVHSDLTTYNIVGFRDADYRVVPTGIIDFGDVMASWRITELAGTIVSALSHNPGEPLVTAAHIVRGYLKDASLTEVECSALWPVVVGRAAVCVALNARQSVGGSNTFAESQTQWDLAALHASLQVPHIVAELHFRSMCGLSNAVTPVTATDSPSALLIPTLTDATVEIVRSNPDDDLPVSESGPQLPTPLVGDGRMMVRPFGEIRFRTANQPDTWRPETFSLTTDVAVLAGTTVHCPFDGTLVRADDGVVTIVNADSTEDYVHLEGVTTPHAVGQHLRAGEQLAVVGAPQAHIHSEAIWVAIQRSRIEHQVPACDPAVAGAWQQVCTDPASLLGLELPRPGEARHDLLHDRLRDLARTQKVYFDNDAPEMVRGWKHWMYDADGRVYLDMINNVAIVGHSHPRLTDAATRQLRKLNTNSRFLYRPVTEYAERILQRLPEPLSQVLFVNSGSEAADLALQLAKTYTGRDDLIAIAASYHGWTAAVAELCTTPTDRPNWRDLLAPNIHIVPTPTPTPASVPHVDAEAALAEFEQAIADAQARGGLAAFMMEPLLGNQGGIEPIRGYFRRAAEKVRGAGGLVIADEVQVGYGRTGRTFWAFEHEGFVPDIVVAAKATGNGHPVGVVVCSRDVADRFDGTSAFFSSTAGSPVSSAIGSAVLDVINDEGLQANALRVGTRLKKRLMEATTNAPAIGAIHGRGLYLGIEVLDPEGAAPSSELALSICDHLRERGVIVHPTGEHFNVLKIKPPLCIDTRAADQFVDALSDVLASGRWTIKSLNGEVCSRVGSMSDPSAVMTPHLETGRMQ